MFRLQTEICRQWRQNAFFCMLHRNRIIINLSRATIWQPDNTKNSNCLHNSKEYFPIENWIFFFLLFSFLFVLFVLIVVILREIISQFRSYEWLQHLAEKFYFNKSQDTNDSIVWCKRGAKKNKFFNGKSSCNDFLQVVVVGWWARILYSLLCSSMQNDFADVMWCSLTWQQYQTFML